MSELVVREIKSDEMGHAASLVANILAGDDRSHNQAIYEQYAKQLPRRPRKTGTCYRVAFHKKQMVSLIHIVDFSLRYGRAALKVVGIGMLCTHPKYRNRGYASAILKDTLTFAAEQGAHLVLVNSQLPGYLQQFGFSPVWAKYTLQAPSNLAAQLEQPLQLRVATPSDLGIMAKLYNHHWGMRVTAERSPEFWRWRMNFGRGESAVMVNKQGRIEGYLWHLPDDFSERNEIVAASPAAIATALAYSGRRWQSSGYDMLRWSVPPDDVIVPYAQQMLPITLSAGYFPSGGWMARVIDSSAMLHELLPEIIAGAKASQDDFDADRLILKIAPDGVDIGLQDKLPTHCHLSLRDFIQILFGSLRPETLAIRQPLSRESVHLLETLFPPRVAAIAGWDWF